MIALVYVLAFITLGAFLFGETSLGYGCGLAMFLLIGIVYVHGKVFEQKNVAVAVLVSAILIVAAIVGCFVLYMAHS
jgi:hypothetical protein